MCEFHCLSTRLKCFCDSSLSKVKCVCERTEAISCHPLDRPRSRAISVVMPLIEDSLTLFQYLNLRREESGERSVGLLGLEASVEEKGVLIGPP